MQQNNNNPSGSDSPLLLADVLQNLGMASESGLVEFTVGVNVGHAYLQYGKIVHATSSQYEGEEAVYEMLLWPEGVWKVYPETSAPKRSIQKETEDLLLEAARRFTGTGSIPVQTNTGRLQTSVGMVGSQPFLIVEEPGLPERTLELTQDLLHVGRQPTNDLQLNDPGLSSRHCVFITSGRDVTLRDLNSTNGTYVNGEAIEEVVLKIGDAVQIGGTYIRFESRLKRPKLSALKKGHYKVDQVPSKYMPARPTLSPSSAIRIGGTPAATAPSKHTAKWMGLVVAIVFIVALLAFFMFHH